MRNLYLVLAVFVGCGRHEGAVEPAAAPTASGLEARPIKDERGLSRVANPKVDFGGTAAGLPVTATAGKKIHVSGTLELLDPGRSGPALVAYVWEIQGDKKQVASSAAVTPDERGKVSEFEFDIPMPQVPGRYTLGLVDAGERDEEKQVLVSSELTVVADSGG